MASRRQFVQLGPYLSDTKSILSGVPQGSILGPFLFNIYVNDIVDIDDQAKFVIYADDTTLLFSATSPNHLIDQANRALIRLEEWSERNKLTVNANKTKAILFRPKNRNVFINEDIRYNNSVVDIVSSFKILGVVFTEQMSWDAQVDYIVHKLSRAVGLTNINKHTFPTQVKVLIYNALFHSHIKYCHLVWGTTTLRNMHKIHRLQKKMLRIISNVPYDHPSLPLFQKHNIMAIHDMYAYHLALAYKKEIRNNVSFLRELACLQRKEVHYPTRNSDIWSEFQCRTNYGEQMIQCRLPKLLNLLHKHDFQLEQSSKDDVRVVLSATEPVCL